MTREEIREGIARFFTNWMSGCPKHWDECLADHPEQKNLTLEAIDDLMVRLDSQGVVIKVDRKLPEHGYERHHLGIGKSGMSDAYHHKAMEYIRAQEDMLKAGYVAVEPLVKDV